MLGETTDNYAVLSPTDTVPKNHWFWPCLVWWSRVSGFSFIPRARAFGKADILSTRCTCLTLRGYCKSSDTYSLTYFRNNSLKNTSEPLWSGGRDLTYSSKLRAAKLIKFLGKQPGVSFGFSHSGTFINQMPHYRKVEKYWDMQNPLLPRALSAWHLLYLYTSTYRKFSASGPRRHTVEGETAHTHKSIYSQHM